MTQRFDSNKKDKALWIAPLWMGGITCFLGIMAIRDVRTGFQSGAWQTMLMFGFFAGIMIYRVLNVHYTIDDQYLVFHGVTSKKKIQIMAIKSVEHSNTILRPSWQSYTTATAALKIAYGLDIVYISLADETAFIQALKLRNPEIVAI